VAVVSDAMQHQTDACDIPARTLGRLEGRLAALEERMDRHEASLGARLSAIEGKLDHMGTTLAQGLGGLRAAHLISGAVLAAGGFIARHLWNKI
jgi:hypothetical protein